MGELETLANDVLGGLRALQISQTKYDADMWDISDPKFDNLRHIQMHLTKTVGKLAALLEPMDHKYHNSQPLGDLAASDVSPIIADLLIHAAQIANVQGLDLGDSLADRYRRNATRFAPQSALGKFGLSSER